ncbi:chaoptin-like [Phlebotomus argentipes]|uniref:chaoptin-like n=1 Tax=Phlebotomus argentipes TaxID=94469 RepID=UPI002892A6D3|nr:chaoptin-like [Phlebotomus argentipes]
MLPSNLLVIFILIVSVAIIQMTQVWSSFDELFNYSEPETLEYIILSGQNENETIRSDLKAFVCVEPVFERFTSVKYIILHYARVLYISSDCFRGMKEIKFVGLEWNELTIVDMRIFSVLNKIEYIYLSDNYIVQINFNITLPELQHFEADNNRLQTIRIDSKNLPIISRLNLNNNQISQFTIESESITTLILTKNRIKSFQGPDLRISSECSVDLSDNLLTKITPDMIANIPHLMHMNLSHNFLHVVPNFNSLWTDLTHNLITTLENVNFSPSNQIRSAIILDSNKIFHFERWITFKNVTVFSCKFCSIHIIEPFFFSNTFTYLSHLELNSNYLTTVHIFEAHEKDLEFSYINLSRNKIQKIGRTDLSRLSRVVKLILDTNDILTIENGAFDQMVEMKYLDLSNNLIFKLPLELLEKNINLKILLLSGNNMAFFRIPGWQKDTGKIMPINSTLNTLRLLHIQNNPLQCGCVDVIRSWAKNNNILLRIHDENVKNGVKPACIVNDGGCSINVRKIYVKDYWHIFNDKRIHDIFEQNEGDE